ncbi:substrate-binding domain-containing protein [Microbacterium profundi]|uniref:Substrate-binding domain-containing protein n=1 Tax=Microbacterium profundi TaxID=450380 RepID=A0ABV3LKI3_9MICO
MNTGRSESIGVISRNASNPGFAVALDGIMAVGAGAGISVIVAGTEYDIDLERAAIEHLLSRRVDALVVSPSHRAVTEPLHSAYDAGVPIVLWERRVDGLDVPVVQSDMSGAGRVVGRHLRSLGHRRVGYISTFPHAVPYRLGDEVGSTEISDRLQSIYSVFAQGGGRPSTDLVRFPARTSAAIQQAVVELLDEDDPPTALIASDAQIGLETLTVLRSRGVSIPDELSLIMFEDPPWASLVSPPLTVVVQPTYDMGRMAAEVALASIGTETRLQRLPVFPADLVLRDSVGPARH